MRILQKKNKLDEKDDSSWFLQTKCDLNDCENIKICYITGQSSLNVINCLPSEVISDSTSLAHAQLEYTYSGYCYFYDRVGKNYFSNMGLILITGLLAYGSWIDDSVTF